MKAILVILPWIVLVVGFLIIGASLAAAPEGGVAPPAEAAIRAQCPTVDPSTLEALPVGGTITVHCPSR